MAEALDIILVLKKDTREFVGSFTVGTGRLREPKVVKALEETAKGKGCVLERVSADCVFNFREATDAICKTIDKRRP
jgi:hypothetical protein